ncbi:MAG TPA: phosphoribosylaminoimidazolesuccinocarboxamide synthase [Candidatus Bathyarchaeia archaeon]
MSLLYRGKTKDVFTRPDGNLEFYFKDDATGYMLDGKPVFNSGYDKVVGQIPGKGKISCKFTEYFFKLFEEKGIPTDMVEAGSQSNVMIVKPAKLLGLQNQAPDFKGSDEIYGLETVFRNEVMGSWWRRYPSQIPGNKLDIVEFYAKGKAGEPDILMVDDALVQLGMMTPEEMETTKSRTKQIGKIMYQEFLKRGFHMVDGKMEWGRDKKTGKIILIDDLSPDTFRVCEGYDLDEHGNCRVNKQCIATDYRQISRFVKCSNCLEFVEVPEDFKRFIEAKNILSADPAGLRKLAEAFKLEV